MGRDCSKASGNVYFEARKAAAEYDDRLYSREKAAELLGVSVSTLADYENGNTKFVPVDKVVLMADLYHQPELKTGYCKHECPIGACMPFCTKTSSIAMAALKVLKGLDDSKIDSLRHRIIDVAADGQVDASEKPELAEILKNVDEIALAMNEVRLVCEKELNADKLREILRIEYGIRSDEELYDAVERMEPLNIGLFTTPIKQKGVRNARTEK